MLGVVEDDRHAAVDRRRDVARADGICAAIGALSVFSTSPSASPTLESARLSTTPPALARVVEQVERLERELEVLQRRDVERGEQRDDVALVERGEHVVVERRRGVDDDEVELLA